MAIASAAPCSRARAASMAAAVSTGWAWSPSNQSGSTARGPCTRSTDSPAETGGLGQQHPHAAGAGIGEAAGRIEWFAGGTGAHQQPPAPPVAAAARQQQGFQGQQQHRRGGHASIPDPVAGQQTAAGLQGQHPLPGPQLPPVAPHRRRRPHGAVHGGGGQHGRLAGDQGAGQQGVGHPLHPAGQAGGAEGGQQHHLGPFGQLDVQGARGPVAPLVGLDMAGLTAEAGQRHRTHQPLGAGAEDAAHQGPPLHQGADELGQLDRGDAAADQHQHTPAGQGIGGPLRGDLRRLSPHRRVPDRPDGRRDGPGRDGGWPGPAAGASRPGWRTGWGSRPPRGAGPVRRWRARRRPRAARG